MCHTFAGQLHCVTQLRALLVLHHRGNSIVISINQY
jgi:hypothetical protein